MDPDAIGRLLDRHEAPLTLFARQLCDAPEDVVQEAFLRLADLDREPDDPGAWLYRVARNLALDASRAAGRRRRHEARAAAASPGWFDPAPIDGPEPAEAEAALRSLPVEEREVIVAHLWGGLTFERVGRAIGVSSSTAHRLYARGLQTLRERMGASCPTRETS
ncbi:sigma-70 family RNA polymerase sigma factor [Paludisphaera sp.]|uniref:RNA polymerase sigma factor n=1 Tax=Paludisphaera sp. TaxID=2017432 RepID=UPI00301CDA8B